MIIIRSKKLVFVPTAGILSFVILYLIAAVLYPGGSYYNTSAPSFSIIHNYWCDLLGEYAINKQINTGRPYAIAAMYVLCTSLVMLWYITAATFNNTLLKNTILVTGVLSFATGTLLFTSWHNLVIHIASAFACISFLLIFIGLYRQKKKLLVVLGVCCGAFGGVNYYIWTTHSYVMILPALQKITFLFFLTWFVLLNKAVSSYSGNNTV